MPKRSDLLLEYRHEGRATWAVRFYRDGQVREYSDTRMEFKDGNFVSQTIPFAWRKLANLVPEELAKVTEALAQADFFALPEQLGDSEVKDGTTFVWMADLDGKTHTVKARGSGASAHPALKLLSQMVQEVTAMAFQREAKK